MTNCWTDLRDGQRCPPEKRFEIEASAPEAWRIVVDEPRLLGPERLDVVEVGEEGRFLIANELGQTERADQEPVRLRLLDASDQPVLVANLDTCSGSKERDSDGRGA